MIDFTQNETLERLAKRVAEIIIERLDTKDNQVFVSRRELSQLTGLSLSMIDRMSAGGHRAKCSDGTYEWKPSPVKLTPLKRGTRTVFDKAESLARIANVAQQAEAS